METQGEMNTMENGRGDNGYIRKPDQPRQPKESRENSKGALRYEEETETWNCAECEQIFTTKEARRAASHAESHTRAKKQKEKQERQAIQQYAKKMQMTSG